MIRKILAGIAGILLAVCVVAGVQYAGQQVFPVPTGLSLASPDSMSAIPFGAKLSVVIAWFLGAFAGIWLALVISRGSRRAVIIVGAAMLFVTVLTLFSFPHPAWMVAAGLVVPIIAGFLATLIVPFEEG